MAINLIKWTDTFLQDFKRGRQFYSELFGWQYADQYHGDQLVYSLARPGTADKYANGAMVAGIAPCSQPKPDDLPWNWGVYILIQELETSIKKVVAAGGRVCKEPMDVMDVGRMAVCIDSCGAVIHLWQTFAEFGANVKGVPGSVCWYELTSPDAQESIRFYADVFGWQAEERQTNGEAHWQFKSATHVVGGMYTRVDETRNQGLWLPYFQTDNMDHQLNTCRKLGGAVVFGPVVETGTGRYAILQDFEGNLFGLAEYESN